MADCLSSASTRGHGGEVYRRAADRPKKQTASHNSRPSFLLSAVVDSFHKP